MVDKPMLFEFLVPGKILVKSCSFKVSFSQKIYKTIKFRSDGEMSIKFVRETFYFRPFFAINKLCSFFQHHQFKLFAFLENKQSKVAVLGLLFNKGNHKTIKFRRDGKMSIGFVRETFTTFRQKVTWEQLVLHASKQQIY